MSDKHKKIEQPPLNTEESYEEIKIRKKQVVLDGADQLTEDRCTEKEEKISGMQAMIKDNTK